MDLLIFALGIAFALPLQVYISRLVLRREQRREAWIRRLNSYENFYRAVAQLVDLLLAGVELPPDQLWGPVSDARKAAYDAGSYDQGNPERTAQMRDLSLELVRCCMTDPDEERLSALRADTERIRRSFQQEDPAFASNRRALPIAR